MVEQLPGLSAPFIVSYHTLTADEKKRLRDAYEFVEFHKVNVQRYQKADKTDCRYWLLEAFNPCLDLDKAIVLGADMICTGSTNRLIYQSHGPIAMWREPVRKCWNSGSMVLEKSVLTKETYEALLAHDKGSEFGRDQGVVNSYFKGKIGSLPETTQKFVDEATVPGGTIWLHFIHKPFEGGGLAKNSPAAIALLKKYMGELWWS